VLLEITARAGDIRETNRLQPLRDAAERNQKSLNSPVIVMALRSHLEAPSRFVAHSFDARLMINKTQRYGLAGPASQPVRSRSDLACSKPRELSRKRSISCGAECDTWYIDVWGLRTCLSDTHRRIVSRPMRVGNYTWSFLATKYRLF